MKMKKLIAVSFFVLLFACGGGGGGGTPTDNNTSDNTTPTDVTTTGDELISYGTFTGISSMKITYRETYWTQRHVRTYETYARIDVNLSLISEADDTETNPFNLSVTTSLVSAGGAVMKSAEIYKCDGSSPYLCDTLLIGRLFQNWHFSGQEGSYKGTYDPQGSDSTSISNISAEDVAAQAVSLVPINVICPAAVKPKATIDIQFSEDKVNITIAGKVQDYLYPTSCVQNVEKFKATISAPINNS